MPETKTGPAAPAEAAPSLRTTIDTLLAQHPGGEVSTVLRVSASAFITLGFSQDERGRITTEQLRRAVIQNLERLIEDAGGIEYIVDCVGLVEARVNDVHLVPVQPIEIDTHSGLRSAAF